MLLKFSWYKSVWTVINPLNYTHGLEKSILSDQIMYTLNEKKTLKDLSIKQT